MTFTSLRKILSLFLLVTVTLGLSGCTYHGRLKRGFYKTPSFDDKIEASVLVVSDRFLQQKISIEDHSLKPGTTYVLRTADGAAVAAADALGTLFSRVEVDSYSKRFQYDYIAEVNYRVYGQGEKNYAIASTPTRDYLVEKKRMGLRTDVTITLRNPHSGLPVLILGEDEFTWLDDTNASISILWLNQVSLSLLFPVTAPVYAQVRGREIRKMLELDLRLVLRRIMNDMEENRLLFSKDHANENLPRNDRQYKEMMKKTTYVSLPDSHGTGFFISPDGFMITNAHVVENKRDVRYYLYEDLPFDAKQQAQPPFRYARVLKVNHTRDLALLKAEGEFPYFELDDDRSHYKTGDTVLVMGSPIESYWTMTEGIISSLNNKNGLDVIQTDAAINGGNSGGPLILKSTGKVIGVNYSVLNPKFGSGMGYSITAFELKRTLGIDQPLDLEKLRRDLINNLPEKILD